MLYVLFPTDYFEQTVDPDYAREYHAVQHTKGYSPLLFDWQLWQEKGKIKLYGKYPREKILKLFPVARPHTLYRGWMMKPEDYTRFFIALHRHCIYPLTEPDEYEVMHEFPRVYPLVQADTPRILTFPIGTPVDLSAVKREFPRFIVKDYVKSVKGSRFPASFDSSITQDTFEQQMKLFYQYRGDQLTGGICIKEYVDLKRYDGHTNEWRVFYYYFQSATCTPNSGQPDDAPAPPESLIQKYRMFKSCFYTIDFAEKADAPGLSSRQATGRFPACRKN